MTSRVNSGLKTAPRCGGRFQCLDSPDWSWPFAIVRLPGREGHIPAEGLKTEVTQPIELHGVMLAAVATIGLGIVLGP
jgi:hypothetical protein